MPVLGMPLITMGCCRKGMDDLSTYVKGSTDLSQYEVVTSGKMLDVIHFTNTPLIRSINVSSEGGRAVVFVDGHSEMVYEQQKK